jgi:hypothetical protein
VWIFRFNKCFFEHLPYKSYGEVSALRA